MRQDISPTTIYNILQLWFYKPQDLVEPFSEGWGGCRQAYVHFAHALKLETNNSSALKGRQVRDTSLRNASDMFHVSESIYCVNGNGVKHFQNELHITDM